MLVKARLLLVEDDPPMRNALGIAFREEGYDVRARADARDIETVLDGYQPDLTIIDVGLGPHSPDGYEVAPALRSRNLPFLFLTGRDDVVDACRGLDLGAEDYVTKPFDLPVLLRVVRARLRARGRRAARQVGDLIVDEDGIVTRAGHRIDLTRLEYEILAELAWRPGAVLSKEDLLQRVWREEAYDINLVEVQISGLRRKLEAFGPRLIHTRRGMGYELRE